MSTRITTMRSRAARFGASSVVESAEGHPPKQKGRILRPFCSRRLIFVARTISNLRLQCARAARARKYARRSSRCQICPTRSAPRERIDLRPQLNLPALVVDEESLQRADHVHADHDSRLRFEPPEPEDVELAEDHRRSRDLNRPAHAQHRHLPPLASLTDQ